MQLEALMTCNCVKEPEIFMFFFPNDTAHSNAGLQCSRLLCRLYVAFWS